MALCLLMGRRDGKARGQRAAEPTDGEGRGSLREMRRDDDEKTGRRRRGVFVVRWRGRIGGLCEACQPAKLVMLVVCGSAGYGRVGTGGDGFKGILVRSV